MDPLSEALALLDIRSAYLAGLKTGGEWAIRFPAPDGIKFNAIVRGDGWLAVDGVDRPVPLAAGDAFMLTQPRPFQLCSDLSVAPVDAADVYRNAPSATAHHGPRDDFFLIGGRYAFRDETAWWLQGLPPVIHVRAASDEASVLRWSLDRLAIELSGSTPGSAVMAEHLGNIMFVQVLRMYLATGDVPVGWWRGLADPRVGAALRAVHADPARRWTVDSLGQVAAVSRSTLALHFRQKVGLGPLEYVQRWRMHLAATRLRNGRDTTIAAIAESLGYDSDAAFSHAFKRVLACSPRQYRERHHLRA